MLSAIVLAAGSSRRMENRNKLLLPYSGRTIITQVLGNLLSAGLEEIIVITGHESSLVSAAIGDLPVRLVHNTSYEEGMTGSIQTGIRSAAGNGYMICLGDMVQITPDEYRILKNAFERQYDLDTQLICLPEYQGEKGNPVIFSDHYRQEILQHQDPEGCKAIVHNHQQHIYKVKMPADHILRDIDTVKDYEEL
jgi:molybdenum cofactor cytidylyltransferase